ncbi:MAG: beta strand repeat-containing protein [Bradyrhizobium sp.]
MAIITGRNSDDSIAGTPEHDLLRGLGGNDTLFGFGGADSLDGGDGSDTLSGDDGADRLNGGAGSDTASYWSARVGVTANLADSSFNTADAAGDTYISIENFRGSIFDDTLIGDDGDNVIEGGAGADIMIGGNGEDTLSYEHASSGVIANLTTSSGSFGDAAGDVFRGFENFRGSAFADSLIGDEGDNVLEGGAGADIMIGGNGSDTLNYEHSQAAVVVNLTTHTGSLGDADGDVFGGFENIRGSAFADFLIGDEGDNVLDGGAGVDLLFGHGGNDTASYAHSSSGVIANLTDNSSNIGDAAGDVYSGIENLRGSAFGDLLVGTDNTNGTEGANIVEGGAGADIMIGGLGSDTLSYEHSGAGVVVNLTTNTSSLGDAEGDGFGGFENIRGSRFDDFLVGTDNTNGTDGANTIEGGGGADLMIAGLGSDTLSYEHSSAGVVVNLTTNTSSLGDAEGDAFGGFENIRGSRFDDFLVGSDNTNGTDGANTIEGGGGADLMISGLGEDTLSYEHSSAGVFANLTTGMGAFGDAEGDRYGGFEDIRGSRFADNLYGDVGDNVLEGGGGADVLLGGGGNDTASYAHASAGVTANLSNAAFNTGDATDDVYNNIQNLTGSAFGDTLVGDGADNILDGRAGNDTLTGGAGNDTFSFRAGFGHDTVMDFAVGQDVIELHDGLFADANAALAAAAQTGTDVTITVDALTSIVLHNVALANLHTSDFHVV